MCLDLIGILSILPPDDHTGAVAHTLMCRQGVPAWLCAARRQPAVSKRVTVDVADMVMVSRWRNDKVQVQLVLLHSHFIYTTKHSQVSNKFKLLLNHITTWYTMPTFRVLDAVSACYDARNGGRRYLDAVIAGTSASSSYQVKRRVWAQSARTQQRPASTSMP